ncbi:MAG: hypothetical protein HZA93_13620 [Verrucomicrobia bacterium]|nr:hypothetical protein [Verrucomicrobiota bacterium]
MTAPGQPESQAAAANGLAEVRYPLPQLLNELKRERSAGTFAMEKLDQTEIGKLFKTKGPRRAKSQK